MKLVLTTILICLNNIQIDYINNYFQYVNKAEMHIVNRNYSLATKEYETAFNANKKRFAKDIYNYLLCSIKLNDRKNAEKLLVDLANKGVELSFIKKNEYIKEFFRNDLDRIYTINFKSIQCNEYCKRVKELVLLDQKIRNQNNFNALIYQNVKDDSQIASEFLKLINENGFPDESNMGFSNGISANSEFAPIIIHQNLKLKSIDFGNTLFNAVKQGQLSPNLAMMLFTSQIDNDPLGFISDQGSNLFTSQMKAYFGYESTIDQERSFWGIDSQKNYLLKEKFQNENPEFDFGLYYFNFSK